MHNTPHPWKPNPDWSYKLGQALGTGMGCMTEFLIINIPSWFLGFLFGAHVLTAIVALMEGLPVDVVSMVISGGLLIAIRAWGYHRLKAQAALQAQQPRPLKREGVNATLYHTVETAIHDNRSISTAIRAITVKKDGTRCPLDPQRDMGFVYGTTIDTDTPLTVHAQETRAHELITGGSGAGKSKFIAGRAAGHAVIGDSLLVIDPHEELAADILGAVAPHLAEKGVIMIWPGGPLDHLYGWNPLAPIPGVTAGARADSVLNAIWRVWQLSEANTYLIDTFKYGAWAMAETGWSMLEIGRFLVDVPFRTWIAAQITTPALREWISHYHALDPRERAGRTHSTLVRLNRIMGNDHLRRMLGVGVTNPHYRQAMRADQVLLTPSNDLITEIRDGRHVFAVLPKRALRGDQYLIAGLVQAAMMEAMQGRQPNHPGNPQLMAILDEAAAYATRAGLGEALPQLRKYQWSAIVAMQGLHQADPDLAEELKTNTAIKIFFATDNPNEAEMISHMIHHYEPYAIKQDTRYRAKDHRLIDAGQIQTYSSFEQKDWTRARVQGLTPRQFILKARTANRQHLGLHDAPTLRTVDFHPSYTLEAALTYIGGSKRPYTAIDITTVDRELAARAAWLEAQGYNNVGATRRVDKETSTRTTGNATRVATAPDGTPCPSPTATALNFRAATNALPHTSSTAPSANTGSTDQSPQADPNATQDNAGTRAAIIVVPPTVGMLPIAGGEQPPGGATNNPVNPASVEPNSQT